MGVGGKRHAMEAWPPGKTRYTLYEGLGGLQDRSAQMRKILWNSENIVHLHINLLNSAMDKDEW
jgi:hypothetical protein